jgi:hypothetical protein
MKKAVWLPFDLGVKGDYESLYQWLDTREAIECGDNVAFFNHESDGIDIPGEIKRSLLESIQVDAKTRVYIIYRQDKAIKGRFLFGGRKAPPWSGAAPKLSAEEDEDHA